MYWGVMAGNMGWGVMEEEGWRKGPWTSEEDRLLIEYVKLHGEGRWNSVSRLAGLKRNGKSCRLRWVNYLRPDLKRGQITPQEETIILELHARWGNRWSTIARSLPGRTDNEIKNYWRTHFKKKATKSPSDAVEKAKNRLMRRQQFQQQQQQQQQLMMKHQQQQQQAQIIQQQQQQMMQLNMVDNMKAGIMYLLGQENDHKVPSISHESMVSMMYNPNNSTTEEQGYYYSPVFSGNNNNNNNTNNNVSSSAPESSNEEIFWDGLWNLDDVFCNFSATSKASLVAPFC